jgi:hypothetical protein
MDCLAPSQRRQAIWRFTGLMLSDAALDQSLLAQAAELLTRALKVEGLLRWPLFGRRCPNSEVHSLVARIGDGSSGRGRMRTFRSK